MSLASLNSSEVSGKSLLLEATSSAPSAFLFVPWTLPQGFCIPHLESLPQASMWQAASCQLITDHCLQGPLAPLTPALGQCLEALVCVHVDCPLPLPPSRHKAPGTADSQPTPSAARVMPWPCLLYPASRGPSLSQLDPASTPQTTNDRAAGSVFLTLTEAMKPQGYR